MGCCDDPTEPEKPDLQDAKLAEQRYGALVRDLFTSPPERVLIRLLAEANPYLRELAALRAHYPEVRLQAIGMLTADSAKVLQRIADDEPESRFAEAARQRMARLNEHRPGLLGKLLGGE